TRAGRVPVEETEEQETFSWLQDQPVISTDPWRRLRVGSQALPAVPAARSGELSVDSTAISPDFAARPSGRRLKRLHASTQPGLRKSPATAATMRAMKTRETHPLRRSFGGFQRHRAHAPRPAGGAGRR